MFEQIEPKRRWLPRQLAVWLVALFAFSLGLSVGKLVAGQKPYDWTITVGNMAVAFIWLVWAALSATRKTS